MEISSYLSHILDWSSIPKEEHKRETGIVKARVFIMGDIRIRKVEYSAGYKADHWCSKDHIILCTEGEMLTKLDDRRAMKFTAGMTNFVSDDCEAHRSSTQNGCNFFIGD